MRKIILLCLFLYIGFTVNAQNDVVELMEDSRLLAVVNYSENHVPEAWYAFSVRDEAGVASLAYGHPDILAVVRIDIVQLFNPENYYHFEEDMQPYFDTIYQGYSPYEFITTCEIDEIILHIHEGQFEGKNYMIHHYAAEYSEHNYMNISLFFPKENYDDLLETAVAFYPDLLSCVEEEE